ncbi:MAG: trigger factor [Elusimicrobia bacterium CG_4_10_14_0_2_um_filter_56_8]|nr:MAG: trigger factor [Elusimicrobia bacterium CG1_02_56_21]PJA16558.1 MAG: trigger factor [Elusimicrobia bacterium CG_4_10_14_0_2_um_filter_56_8]
MNITLGYGDKIKKIKQEGCVHLFGVSLDSKALDEAAQEALVRLQSVVSLPGFRVGKVPLAMIKAQFPSMVKDEVLDIAAKASLPEIFKGSQLNPVVAPLLKNVSYEPAKSLYFEIQFECSPTLEPKGYEKIAATRKVHNITDAEVDKYINQVREYNAYLKPAAEGEAAAKNHFVIVDYDTFENGVPVADAAVKGEIVDLSSPQTIAGLADAVTGAKKGESREFDAPFGDKKMHFKVTVTEIKQKIVPGLDENFLKEAGVKTVEELKGNVRKLLEQGAAEKTEKDMLGQLEEALIKNNPLALPPTVVKEETQELLELFKKRAPVEQHLPDESLIERLRPVAERNLSLTYILHHIAKKENIQATDSELDAELEKVMARLNTEEEKAKGRDLFEKRKEYIRASMVENKTMTLVKEKAVIKEEKA